MTGRKFPFLLLALLLLTPGFAGEAAAESLLASRTLRVGSQISAQDIVVSPDEIVGAARSRADVLGLEVRRTLYAGRPIRPADLGPPTLVRRNDQVTMVYRIRGLLVTAEGRALDSGGQEERVRVMNLQSRASVFAKVIGVNEVEVSP